MRAPITLVLATLLFSTPPRAEAPRVLGVSDQWLLAHLRAPFAVSCAATLGPSGLVVAGIELAAGSSSVAAEILEAPSLALAECVQRSLLGLRFRPPEGKPGERYRSKLMLYAVKRSSESMEIIPAARMSPARLQGHSQKIASPAEPRS